MRGATVLILLAACGHEAARPDAAVDTALDPGLLAQLQALPGVTASEQPSVRLPPGYHYFVLHVTQPVDHAAPAGATFQQEVSLIHVDRAAPMVAYTTGYDDYVRDRAAEPTGLLHANQISIEHRFFATSRPAPADWSKLTIAQMAADEHAIIALLKPIYRGAWISAGGSKGGMTAIYHRRFYPDDVAGTIAYVAPQSFGIPDPRYATFLDVIGTPGCRTAVRAYVTEMLANRRTPLLQRAIVDGTTSHHAYTRIAIGPALESAIQDFEWTFWQYFGVARCDLIPAVTATDDQMWSVLNMVSPVGFSDDDSTARYEAYFYQAYAQLGSPGTVAIRGDTPPSYLRPYAIYTDDDYARTLPVDVPIPAFDAAAMRDIDDWVEHQGSRILFIYGEWDPWTGGKFPLGNATDSLSLVMPQGTHGSSLAGLPPTERAAALAKISAWTGVALRESQLRELAPSEPWPQRHGPAR